MINTYSPGNTATLVFQFYNSNKQPTEADGAVLITVGEEGITTVLVSDGEMTFDPVKLNYFYNLFIPENIPLGEYQMKVTATIEAAAKEQLSILTVGGAYVTADELKNMQIGFDFSKYSPEQLTYASLLAKELIDSYCDIEWGGGLTTQKGETVVDNLGRVYIRFKRRPVIELLSIKVWVPGSTSIELSPKYLDLFSKQGYGYYPISTAYGASAVGTYPLVVLGYMDKLLYQIEYIADSNIPLLIKHASALICANIMRADYYLTELGMPNTVGPVDTFKTGSYAVGFDTKGMYKGKGFAGGQFLTPNVQEILDRFKVMRNNSMF